LPGIHAQVFYRFAFESTISFLKINQILAFSGNGCKASSALAKLRRSPFLLKNDNYFDQPLPYLTISWEGLAMGEVCSGAVFTSSLNEDLKFALKTMQQQKVRRLPVLDDEGKLQGILSLGGITLRTGDAKGKSVPDLTYEDVVKTYQAIRAQRPEQQAMTIA
jgi:hypothetical protein